MQGATEAQVTPSTDGAAGSSTGHNGHRPTSLLILTKTRSRTEADESAEMLCKLHTTTRRFAISSGTRRQTLASIRRKQLAEARHLSDPCRKLGLVHGIHRRPAQSILDQG